MIKEKKRKKKRKKENIIYKFKKEILANLQGIPRNKQAPIIKRHFKNKPPLNSIATTHRLLQKTKLLDLRDLKIRHESPQRSQSVRWRRGQSILGNLFFFIFSLSFSCGLISVFFRSIHLVTIFSHFRFLFRTIYIRRVFGWCYFFLLSIFEFEGVWVRLLDCSLSWI